MCRNIRVLHHFEPPTTTDEIRAAAEQYVRKVSGLRARPSSNADEAEFVRAIAAGKHVLCEKPMAANATEAARIASAAAGTGLVVAEAMHFRYHPLVERVRSILAAGEIGALRRIDASFSAYLPFDDFRFDYRLGGGGTIDMGCYPVGFVRAVTGEEPVVESARAKLHGTLIDRQMEATLRLPTSGAKVDLFVGMRCSRLLSVSMRIEGSRGRVDILNFIKPEVYHRLVVRSERGRRVERVPGGSTYRAQLAAFAEAVLIVQGVVFVVVVMLFRRGIVGEIGHWLKKPL